ncbi:cytochrome p450 monooxygenase [Myxozyma melibiosi]|uniref:Cytochrome p450 monooxygenase n=1 Tax=Myxozyma melibiosi TaxID=54550 RepID=A0ABR1F5F5_9ASCO
MFALLALCALFLSCLWAAKCVVDYFRDPHNLRQYPSLTPLCAFTNLGYLLYIYGGDFRSRRMHALHRVHPVIRTGPASLSFADMRAINDIYGHATPCKKGPLYELSMGAHANLVDSVDHAEHAQKRKRLSNAFALKNLERWEFKVVDKCTRLVAQFDRICDDYRPRETLQGEKDAPVVSYRTWTNLFTVEAIADIALSQRLGFLESGTDLIPAEETDGAPIYKAHFIDAVHGSGRVNTPIVWSEEGYKIFKRVLNYLNPQFRRQIRLGHDFDNIIHYLARVRQERYERGEKLDDFFTCLMEDREGKRLNLDPKEVRAEVNIIMNAGSDTTAVAMTNAMYNLLKNPDKLAKLREELEKLNIPSDTIVPPYSIVRHCAYLRAVLDESLRVLPPLPLGLQRVTPPEGSSIAGRWIAGNTVVSVPAYSAHRDPNIFPDPEQFMPERWLTDSAKSFSQKYFIPFSMGSRGCIGRNITYLEQQLLLATLVRRYDFAFADPNFEPFYEERMNLLPGDMQLRIRRRG